MASCSADAWHPDRCDSEASCALGETCYRGFCVSEDDAADGGTPPDAAWSVPITVDASADASTVARGTEGVSVPSVGEFAPIDDGSSGANPGTAPTPAEPTMAPEGKPRGGPGKPKDNGPHGGPPKAKP